MKDKVQIAIKVEDGDSLKDLNDHLEMGWKVVNMCAMPSSGDPGNFPTCLVIIEGENCE